MNFFQRKPLFLTVSLFIVVVSTLIPLDEKPLINTEMTEVYFKIMSILSKNKQKHQRALLRSQIIYHHPPSRIF